MGKNKGRIKIGFSRFLWAVIVITIGAIQPCLAVDYVYVEDGETVNLDYEVVYAVYVYSGGTLNILNNAKVHLLTAYPDSTVNLKGGVIEQYGVSAYAGSNITIHGIYDSHSPESGAHFDHIYNSLVIEDTSFGWTGNLTCTYDEPSVTSTIPISTFTNINFTSVSGPEQIDVDIKPGSYPNAINLGSNGVIPVAILSTADFDATLIPADTIFLAGSGVAVRGKGNNTLAYEEDVNGDALLDLVVKVETENLDPGTFQDGSAVLRIHETSDQTSPVLYEGLDEITIVPPE